MNQQVFSIYCHEDTDGGIAAAIFGKFILAKYAQYGWTLNIVPVSHEHSATAWFNREILFPCAILDFSLHIQFLTDRFFTKQSYWEKKLGSPEKIPPCYWIDHHSTGAGFSFINEKNVENFVKNAIVFFDTHANSTPGLLRTHYKNIGISGDLIKEYEEYIDYAEIIDGALYASPNAAHDFLSASVKLNALFATSHEAINNHALYKQLVAQIIKSPNPENLFDSDPLLGGIIEFERELFAQKFTSYNKVTTCQNNIAVCNFMHHHDMFIGMGKSVGVGRFIPYMLFPEVEYAIHVLPLNNGYSGISCGINPWNKPTNSSKHLGNFFAQEFSGGGHSFVAGGKLYENDLEKLNKLICFLRD